MVIQGLDFQYHGSKQDATDNDLYNSAAEDELCTESSGSNNCATKRKRDKSGASKSLPKTHKECKQSQRNAANSRERARMRVLSKAFSRLKTSLPWVPPDTKLSKLDTLRLASNYIGHLRQILQEDRHENCFVHPVNLCSLAVSIIAPRQPHVFLRTVFPIILLLTGKSISVTYVSKRMIGNVV
ncbi:UNVERIFIED_CONTAM: hypothetical protein FKN15_064089 [Acipenser sinensis]